MLAGYGWFEHVLTRDTGYYIGNKRLKIRVATKDEVRTMVMMKELPGKTKRDRKTKEEIYLCDGADIQAVGVKGDT